MSSTPSHRIESPCIRLCTLDNDDICVGCFRSIDEIKLWHGADDQTRNQILMTASKRAGKRENFNS